MRRGLNVFGAVAALAFLAACTEPITETGPIVTSSTAEPIDVPEVPTGVNGVAWEATSAFRAEVAGPGVIIVDGVTVTGLDGTSGEERWTYQRRESKPSGPPDVTPNGELAVVPYAGDLVVVLDTMTGEPTREIKDLDYDAVSSGWQLGDRYMVNGDGSKVVDLTTGESRGGPTLSMYCGGPEPEPDVAMSAEILVVACWQPGETEQDDQRTTQVGTLEIIGLDPSNWARTWRAKPQPFESELDDPGNAPNPLAMVKTSTDGQFATVSWTVAAAGRFVEGGVASTINVADGTAVDVPADAYFTPQPGVALSNSGAVVNPLPSGAAYRCPVPATANNDCLSNRSGVSLAVLLRESWVGLCSSGGGAEPDAKATALCVRPVAGGPNSPAARTIPFDEQSSANETAARDVRIAPGAVVVSYEASGGWNVVGVR